MPAMPPMPNERHVGRAPADVDEHGTCVAQLPRRETCGDGVGLCDHAKQLEPKRRGYRLQRPKWTMGAKALKIESSRCAPVKPMGLLTG